MFANLISVLLFFLLFIYTGGLLGGAILYKISDRKISPITALSAGAVFLLPGCLLLLYYLFLLTPGLSPLFYLWFVFSVVFLSAAFYHQSIRIFLAECQPSLTEWLKPIPPAIFFLLLVPSCMLAAEYLAILKPFTEHDAMEYAVYGTRLSKTLDISYHKHCYDATSGFYYTALHGPAFPLLRTFEVLLGKYMPLQDIVFRSINAVAGFLLIWICGAAALLKNRAFSYWMMFCLLCSYVFLFTFLQVSIDHFRMMQLFAFALVWFECRNNTMPGRMYFALWLMAGMAGFAHSLNFLLLSGFFIIQLFPLSNLRKPAPVFLAALGFLAGGGLHYLLDTAIGTGWIFQ